MFYGAIYHLTVYAPGNNYINSQNLNQNLITLSHVHCTHVVLRLCLSDLLLRLFGNGNLLVNVGNDFLDLVLDALLLDLRAGCGLRFLCKYKPAGISVQRLKYSLMDLPIQKIDNRMHRCRDVSVFVVFVSVRNAIKKTD